MSSELLKAYFQNIEALAPEDLEAITSQYKKKKVPKGEFLLRQGEVCRFEGYVVEGCFKVSVSDTAYLHFGLFHHRSRHKFDPTTNLHINICQPG